LRGTCRLIRCGHGHRARAAAAARDGAAGRETKTAPP
jgi:hypothetical protein